jgi:SAM-dependent methyltransferase
VVQSIWSSVVDLGFAGGRVLEPGCGSGNFIGMAPAGLALDIVGVELDPTTAAVAQALYPGASIRAEGFERSRLPEGSFDLVVGNVPFAKVALYDPRHNRGNHSLHNHFLVKSLELTHPGGLVAVITSRFTLDARNPAARREMAELADLVGAVRLPGGTMRSAAGTDAITDLVVLRRREPGRPATEQAWERTLQVATPDGEVAINEYFAAHPGRVLGELCATGGQYSESDMRVRAGERPVLEVLEEALAEISAEAKAEGLVWTPGAPAPLRRAEVVALQGGATKEGSLVVAANGGFARVESGVGVAFQPAPAKDRAELRALIDLRELRDPEAPDEEEDEEE